MIHGSTRQENSRHQHLFPLFILIIVGILFVYVDNSFVPTPINSHYFVAHLGKYSYQDPEITAVFRLLYTPIYHVIFKIFLVERLYVLTTYLVFIILLLSIYYIFFIFTENVLLSYIMALTLNPCAFHQILYVGNYHQFGGLSTALHDYFEIIYPQHFGWDTSFSVRALSGIIYIYMVLFFLTDKYIALIASIFCVFFIHPNNGLILAFMFISSMAYLSIKGEIGFKYPICAVLFSLVAMLPSIVNLIRLKNLDVKPLNGYTWYNLMSKVNPDNFSALYLVKNHTAGLLLALFFPLIIAIYFLRQNRLTSYERRLALLCIIPYLIFSATLALELVVSIFHVGLFSPIILSGQLGLKSLELVFLPAVLLLISSWSNA